MSVTIKWDITYKCNLNCNHCINGKYLNKDYDEIDLETIKKIVSEIDDVTGIEYIHFLGGEPTTRKDFIDICKYLDNSNIRFGFNSNGIKLNHDYVKELSKLKYLDRIVLSLESPIKEENDAIRGRNVYNCINNAIDTINENISRRIIAVNMVVSKKNYKSIDQMIDFCLKRNVKELSFLQLIEEGNAKDSHLSLNYDEIVESAIVIGSRSKEDYKKIKLFPKFLRPLTIDYVNKKYDKSCPSITHGCGAGTNFIYLDNEGKLYPCDRIKFKNISDNTISLREKEFSVGWEDDMMAIPFCIMESDEYRNLKVCSDCKYFMNTCFPCSLDNFKSTNNQCIETNKRINEFLYGNIEMNYGPFRIYDDGTKSVIYNVANAETIEVDQKAKFIFDKIRTAKNIGLCDLDKIADEIDLDLDEIIDFINYLSECGFLSKPKVDTIKCLKNIEDF